MTISVVYRVTPIKIHVIEIQFILYAFYYKRKMYQLFDNIALLNL